ncbi:glycosyltransferase family 39 protein [Nocardioides donggukensis]|uniref:Glycosyltransferase RgtA/B/C/D-like domain-containing protein n=1 Tax=Nocardioides donggukensis TaxID=2774019 RepID=A0A927Q1E6_9ACTN|nr:hypothetical protein [Nocardioides donggukensis]MBD8869384.1 hypothetical protein [Nocardioides donggukensis]
MTVLPPGAAPGVRSTPGARRIRRSDRTLVPTRLGRHPVAAASLVGGTGLLLQAVGYALGWSAAPGALALFYVGHVVLVVPFALLLASGSVGRGQRIAGAVIYSLTLYLSWFLSNPVLATRFDETLHVATLRDLVAGGGFFAPNTMLPVSPYYPGIELVAGALHWLTGVPFVAAQFLVVVIARVALVLLLFGLAERLTRSSRAAALAVLLYSASSQFYFFNAQFSYQTVALPLAVAAVLLTVRAVDARGRRWPVPAMAAAVASLAALVVTHHLTSWLTLAALWAWGLAHLSGEERRPARIVLTVAGLGTLAATAWTAVVGRLLAVYLLPLFDDARTELGSIITGQGGERELFADRSGYATPLWERGVMFGSLLLWLALLVPAGWYAYRGLTLGRSRARLLPLAVAVVFPALLGARFSPTASDVAERASSFVSMAMAVVIAAWLVAHLDRVPRAAVALGAVVMVLGGTILGGGPDWSRVPGPYLPAAEQRSVDGETLAVARWSAENMPPGSRFAADTTMNRVIPDFAEVSAVTGVGGGTNVTPIFGADEVDTETVALIRSAEIDFIVVDTRLADEPPRSGSLYEASDGYGVFEVSAAQLAKFDGQPGFEKVLSGPVEVYDVRSLRAVPVTYADGEAPLLPGPHSVWRMLVAVALAAALVAAARTLRHNGRPRHRPRPRLHHLSLALPGLMAVGVLAALSGFSAILGSLVLEAAAVAGILRLHARPLDLPTPSRPAVLRWGVISGVYLVAFAVAAWAAWHGLVVAEPTPPGPGTP